MTGFIPLPSRQTLHVVRQGLRTAIPFVAFLDDFFHGLYDLFDQIEAVRPVYYGPAVLFLRVIVIAAYTYGANMDYRPVLKGREGVLILKDGNEWAVFKDRDEAAREKRMGSLGQLFSSSPLYQSEKSGEPHDDTSIQVAVICPMYLCTQTDVDALKALRDRLIEQTRAPDLIVFVDDGSTLAPPASEEKGGETVRHLRLPENIGPAAARNAGIDFAVSALGNKPEHTVILLLDIDCIPPPEWVQRGIDAVRLRRSAIGLDGDEEILDPLIVGGLTKGIGSSIVSRYHDFYGTLNPRILRIAPTTSSSSQKGKRTRYRPLYAPTCNMAIFLGSPKNEKRLPRFNEAFREPAQEDVLFCLEAVYRRGCEITMNKESRKPPWQNMVMQHMHREGVLATWTTLRKYGRWFPAVHLLFPSYLPILWGSTQTFSSLEMNRREPELMDSEDTRWAREVQVAAVTGTMLEKGVQSSSRVWFPVTKSISDRAVSPTTIPVNTNTAVLADTGIQNGRSEHESSASYTPLQALIADDSEISRKILLALLRKMSKPRIFAITGLGSSDPRMKVEALREDTVDGWLVKGEDSLARMREIVTDTDALHQLSEGATSSSIPGVIGAHAA
ncbi:hypothetical protein QFC21_006812 [Naganishia friedmannii]|uniref:Uncharacterized protein n=1 Tax=Naganishia friedmannii TaxID=89922 RepID=A0ACC2V0G6_9TREE|nr:hypothetical protein QFC21_006812 [Naganishia friedmannii]